MLRALAVCAVLGLAGGGCASDGGSCALPAMWSSATSGGLCQVNFYTTPEHATYCGGMTGAWDCACGPAPSNPKRFTSTDFCDLDEEARACQAIAACGFPL